MYTKQLRSLCVSLVVFFLVMLFGAYSVFAQAGGMIASPTTLDIGEQIAVVWALAVPSGNDWVSMHKEGAPDSEFVTWQKATPTVDGDGKGGVLYFKADTPGRFQFRLFRNGERYAVSNIVTVNDHVAEATHVPLGGGPKAQPTVGQSGGPPWENARQSNVDGGVNLSIVCANLGYPDVVNLDNTANGWRCKKGNDLYMLDWDSICRRVYGGEYKGVKISNALDGWRCQKGQTQPPVVNPTSVPPKPNNECAPNPSRLKAGDIAVVSDFNEDPLEVYHERNVKTGVKFTVPIREKVQIIQGQSCAYNVTWVEVGWNGNSGWAIEVNSHGNYNLIPNGMPLPGPGGRGYPTTTSVPPTPVPPTSIPPTQTPQIPGAGQQIQTQLPSVGGNIRCDGRTTREDSSGVLAVSYRRKSGNSTYEGTDGECGEFVLEQFRQMNRPIDDCIKEPSGRGVNLTANWDDNVRVNCSSWLVDSNPGVGAVVVWDAGCPFGYGKFAGTSGHAAIVIKTPTELGTSTILVDESNWVNSQGTPDHTRHTGQYAYPLESCMHFIHVPEKPGDNPTIQAPSKQYPPFPEMTVNWDMAKIVQVVCVSCNTKDDWVEVELPTDHFVLSSITLHLAYMPTNIGVPVVSIVPRSSGGGKDTMRFVVDAGILGQIAREKGLSISQLRDPSAWYVRFTHK